MDERPSPSPSARDYVESLHQNNRATLLFGKNNVLVQPVTPHASRPCISRVICIIQQALFNAHRSYTFTHRRRRQPCRATDSSSKEVSQGHLDTRGARRTRRSRVSIQHPSGSSQPSLTERLPPLSTTWTSSAFQVFVVSEGLSRVSQPVGEQQV